MNLVMDEYGRVLQVGGVVPGNEVITGTYNPIGQQQAMEVETSIGDKLRELAYLHGTVLGRLAEIETGTGDDKGRQNPTTAIRRPWLDPPPGYDPFDEAQLVALPAVGSTSTILTFTVPEQYDGVINAISWNFTGGGFVNGNGNLKVQILRNGVPIKNFDNILVEKGSIQLPRPISPLRIFSKQVITMTVEHVANAALSGNVVASLVGYTYPSLG